MIGVTSGMASVVLFAQGFHEIYIFFGAVLGASILTRSRSSSCDVASGDFW